MSGNFKTNGEFLDFLYNDCPFFGGQITRTQAKEILEGKPNGSCLLREKDSTRESNNFQFEVAVKLRIANGKVCFGPLLTHKVPRYYLRNCLPVPTRKTIFAPRIMQMIRSKIRSLINF